jgi:uncharacterized protein
MGTMLDTFTLKLSLAISAATLVALGVLAYEAKPAAAQEFDCRNADYASERTICRNGDLGALDEQMNGLYAELLKATAGKQRRADIKDYQRRFLDARDACGRDTNCIKGAYLDQISVLDARLEQAYRRSER